MSRAFGTPSTVTRNDPHLSCVALNEWFSKWWTGRWCSDCSSVPWFTRPMLHIHTTVKDKSLRCCFPHLNANTFWDIWGLLYACSLLFAHVLPSCWSSILSFLKAPHKHILLKICWALWCCYPKTHGKTVSCPVKCMLSWWIHTTSKVWKRNSQAFISRSI